MEKALANHRSPESAHLTFAYPFGRTVRCLRREWIERADKGQAAKMERFVTQTSIASFNTVYTDRITADGLEAANAWAEAEARADRVRWNKPKAGTYSPVVIIVERPLDDGTGRLGIQHEALSAHSSLAAVLRFKDLASDVLDAWERRIVDHLERIARESEARRLAVAS
jgi:hypothetical protein